MSSASGGGDDGRKVAGILNAISGALGGDYGRKMASIMKAMSSASVGDDGCKLQDDGREMPNGRISSSVEETGKGGEISLKKGPWTQAEDAILIEYVEKYGEGNWNAIQKNSGLARCGKSCRFRWVNHLRPNLKQGAITAEEEQRIVELHASMGNKWSKMAAELPGRTDNEIKNFWKTRNKRKRASLTTYPEEVEIHRQEVPNGNEASLNPNAALKNEVGQHDNVTQSENLNIPDVEFRRLTVPPSLYDRSLYMPMPEYKPMPMMHPSKRLRGSDMIYNSLGPYAVPGFDQYNTSDSRLLCPYADINGNISASSNPVYGDFKVELPSLQYFEARKRSWQTHESSLPPMLEAADTPESSIQSQPNESVPVTHLNNDGLLEPVLYGSKNLNGSNNVDTFQENNDHCVFNEVVKKSTLNPSETQWDEQEALRSSLGPHAASVIDPGVGLTQVPADSSRSVGGFVEPRSFA